MGFFSRFSKKEGPSDSTTLVPGVGRLPYPAYQGNEPYIFVSYSHADSDRVFAEIKRFNEAGYHVWYDEGISPGNEWDDEIAEALEKCTLFVVFLTKNSVNSKNVKNEIDFAIDDEIPAIGIYLEPCELKGGLKLRFRHAQAILRHTITTEEEYVYRFTKAFAKYGINSKKIFKAPEPNADNSYVETVNKPVTDNTPQQPVNPQNRSQRKNEYNDSPEDAKKRANGDLVRVDDYDIEHGSLKGYFGTDKDLKIPNSAVVIPSTAFSNCRLFVESIDLNRAGCVLDYAFENCPKLHTIKVPPTVTTFKPNAIVNCPNVTLYIRRDQLPEGYEDRFTGKKIVYLDELKPIQPVTTPNVVPKPPVQAAASVLKSAPETPLPINEHEWGSFVPNGTAYLTTKDGTVFTAVANSLLYQSPHVKARNTSPNLFPGIQTMFGPRGEENGKMVFFSEIESVETDEDDTVVTDVNGEEYDMILSPAAEYWFIGEKDVLSYSRLNARQVVSITFDRSQTLYVPIRYCRVSMTDGCINVPVAYIWLCTDNGRNGIPSLMLRGDISRISLSSSFVTIKELQKISVIRNGKEATDDSPATAMRMKAFYRTGGGLKLKAEDRYDDFYVITSGGKLRKLPRDTLKEISIYPYICPLEENDRNAQSMPIVSEDYADVLAGYDDFADFLNIPQTPMTSFVLNSAGNELLEYIGNEKYVIIPKCVTEIGRNSFSGSDIVGVFIPDNVKSIWAGAFENCTSLEKVFMSGTMERLVGPFANDVSLKTVRMPDNIVDEFADDLFSGCTSLEYVEIPDTYNKIGGRWFKGCTSLNGINIPGSVKEVSYDVFENCTSLTDITLNEGLKSIFISGFKNCPIDSLIIPESVTGLLGTDDCKIKLIVHKGSPAEQYVKEQHLNYEVID